MFFVLKSSFEGKQMMLSVEPDWDHACYAGLPNEGLPNRTMPPGTDAEVSKQLAEQAKVLADNQSMLIVLNGVEEVQAFATQMNNAPEPWCNYAAAFCGIAEEMGLCAAAHLWMPNFHETSYGKAKAAHMKLMAC